MTIVVDVKKIKTNNEIHLLVYSIVDFENIPKAFEGLALN
jgi:hypothetical protein